LVEVGDEMLCETLPLSFPPAGRLVFPVAVHGFSLIFTDVVSFEVPPFLSGGEKVMVPVMPDVAVVPLSLPQLTDPFAVTVGMFLTAVDADALPPDKATTTVPEASASAAAPKMYLRKRTICSS